MLKQNISRRSLFHRFLLSIGSIVLLYPLLRFINHRVPRKPITIKVTEPLTQDRFLVKDDFFIFSENKQVWGISRKCTHLGCRLLYKEEDDIIECPCHQSRFSNKGLVLNGPSKKELKKFKIEKNSDPPFFIVSM